MIRRRSFVSVPLVSSRPRLAVGAAVSLTFAVIGAACSANDAGSNFDTSGTDGSGGSNGSSSAGASGQGGATSTGTGAGGDLFADGGVVGNQIEITPKSPILKLELPLAGQTIQFQCVDAKTKEPVAAVWKLSAPDLGQISPLGLFTPSGKTTGEVEVSCEDGKAVAKTKLTVLIHAMDNLGGVAPNDQATLKAESAPTITEMAKWLKANASAKVFIVGHTDMQGAVERNQKLSRDRASAVIAALTKDHEIKADRLAADGVGPLAPVASNTDEAGRAKNRRVEMVLR